MGRVARRRSMPCFNPNDDNVNFQDNDQAIHDGRWLLVWQQMARHTNASASTAQPHKARVHRPDTNL